MPVSSAARGSWARRQLPPVLQAAIRRAPRRLTKARPERPTLRPSQRPRLLARAEGRRATSPTPILLAALDRLAGDQRCPITPHPSTAGDQLVQGPVAEDLVDRQDRRRQAADLLDRGPPTSRDPGTLVRRVEAGPAAARAQAAPRTPQKVLPLNTDLGAHRRHPLALPWGGGDHKGRPPLRIVWGLEGVDAPCSRRRGVDAELILTLP
jgi:hypothetical protein